jgi:hypothetical protein
VSENRCPGSGFPPTTQAEQQVRGHRLRVDDLRAAHHRLELRDREPLRAHVLLGGLAARGTGGQLGGQEDVPALAGHARGDVDVAEQLHPPGHQPGLLDELARRQLGRVLLGPVGRGAHRELPAARPDRVAELLDQVQAVAVERDHDGGRRLVDHPEDPLGAVGAAHVVLADGHPGVGVDLPAVERLHGVNGARPPRPGDRRGGI